MWELGKTKLSLFNLYACWVTLTLWYPNPTLHLRVRTRDATPQRTIPLGCTIRPTAGKLATTCREVGNHTHAHTCQPSFELDHTLYLYELTANLQILQGFKLFWLKNIANLTILVPQLHWLIIIKPTVPLVLPTKYKIFISGILYWPTISVQGVNLLVLMQKTNVKI